MNRHNDRNGLFHSDDYFYKFFKNYKEMFANSYLFVMGDHGNRFGRIRETPVGEAEDNNPFLFLSIPEQLRENLTFADTIKKNSRKLLTHYDLYATMVEMTRVSFRFHCRLCFIFHSAGSPPSPEPHHQGFFHFPPFA